MHVLGANRPAGRCKRQILGPHRTGRQAFIPPRFGQAGPGSQPIPDGRLVLDRSHAPGDKAAGQEILDQRRQGDGPQLGRQSAFGICQQGRQPRIGAVERHPALLSKGGDLFGANATGGSFRDQRVERFPVAGACEVQFQEGRRPDRVLGEAGKMDDQLRLVDPAGQRFEGQHQLQVAAAERPHVVWQTARLAKLGEPIDKAAVVIVQIQPDDDPMPAHPVAQVSFERFGNGIQGSHSAKSLVPPSKLGGDRGTVSGHLRRACSVG
jgi:hypothetical protein